MFSNSFTSLRRFSGYVLTLLFLCVFICTGAGAQTTTPPVTASFAKSLSQASGWGFIEQSAVTTHGDLVVVDAKNLALYEFPAVGGSAITLIAPGGLGSGQNPGVAIDGANNLYLEGDWNNCILKFPYNAANATWTGLSTVTPASGSQASDACNGTYKWASGSGIASWDWGFQPWGIAVDANGNFVVADQHANFIFYMPVNGGFGGTPQKGTELVVPTNIRASSVALDKYGNVYFVDEPDSYSGKPAGTQQPGVYMVAAGETYLTQPKDDNGNSLPIESLIPRVDPSLKNVTGVTTDLAGNLYISDSKLGVYMVPNASGTPDPTKAVLLSSVPATGQVSIDGGRNILYIPTLNADGATYGVQSVNFNSAEFGNVQVGAATATSGAVTFTFNGAATPASFAIEQAGSKSPDFAISSGGTCAAGTAYDALANCTVNVNVMPHAAGSASAKLAMLDDQGNVMASIALHAFVTGPSTQVFPSAESGVGTGLKTPTQVATDSLGNIYVADPGAGAVAMFPAGATASTPATAVGTGLTAPSGVAVDGAGNVLIADSGNVIEVPEGPGGLNPAGQTILKTGLGTNLRIAADGSGNVYVADPDNMRVVELTTVPVSASTGLPAQGETDLTGFQKPSVVALDANSNLYVVDESKLYKVTANGVVSTVLTDVTGATGIALDPAGNLFVALPTGTVRIPNVSGTLTESAQTKIAQTVTAPLSLVMDPRTDLFILDGTAVNVHLVSADALGDFGTLKNLGDDQSLSFELLNNGNAPLNIASFAPSADFSATSNTCVGNPLEVEATCSVTVEFNPGPGDQGPLSGQVVVESDGPAVAVDGIGVGEPLSASTTTATLSGSATVEGVTVSVVVAPTNASSTVPTGNVNLVVTGNGIQSINTTSTLSGGSTSITVPAIPVGTYSIQANYAGDRIYGTSSSTISVTAGPGAVNLVLEDGQPSPVVYNGVTYVLSHSTGNLSAYDGSDKPYYYAYPVDVVTATGAPLVGVPIITNGSQSGVDYGTVTFNTASGAPPAGCAPVSVAAVTDANNNVLYQAWLHTECLPIDTSNNTLVNLDSTYTLTPVYSPATNPNYLGTQMAAVSFTAVRSPVVSIASDPATLTLSSGSTATANLTLSSVFGYGTVGNNQPQHNYTLPVELECDGLPAYASCSFSYPSPDPSDASSVAVTPTVPGKVIMTVTTNVSAGTVSLLRAESGIAFGAMFGIGLLGLSFRKKLAAHGRFLTVVWVLMLSGLLAGLTACSTKQLGGTTPASTNTPKGTYDVTVTAKQVGSVVVTTSTGNQTIYGTGQLVSLPYTIKVTIQ